MKKLLIGLIILLAFIVLIAYSASWGHFTAFYSDCMRIQVGMSTEDVEIVMQQYINNPKFHFSREGTLWGAGVYVSSNSSNNQCNIQIRENKVTIIDAIFD